MGIIGTGRIAHLAYLPVLMEHRQVTVEAVVARTQETLDKVCGKYKIPHQFRSVDDLISKVDIDCAFVLTPSDMHTEYVCTLLKKGIDVFCEKPMALSLREAERMVSFSNEYDKILMVGFNRRYAPVYVKAKEAFLENEVEVCFVEKNKQKNERRALVNDAIHVVDIMRWYCGGEAKNVISKATFSDPYYETTISAIVEFDNESQGVVLINRTGGQWIERVEVYGNNKTAIVEMPNLVKIIRAGKTEMMSMIQVKWGVPRIPDTCGFRQSVDHFLDCINRKKRPLTSGEDAFKTHRLVDEMYKQAGLPPLE